MKHVQTKQNDVQLEKKTSVNQSDLLAMITLMDTYNRLQLQEKELSERHPVAEHFSVYQESSIFIQRELVTLLKATLEKVKEDKAQLDRLTNLNLEIIGGNGKLIL